MVERVEKLRFCPYEVPQTCKSEENNKRNPPELPAPRAQRSSSFPQTCNHISGLHLRQKKVHICGLHGTKERMSSRRSQIRANIRTHGFSVQPRDRKMFVIL